MLPNHKTPVYMWMKVGDLFPDAPTHHQNLDYRQPVPPTVVPSIWSVHAPENRFYCATFNTWDLWTAPNNLKNASYEAVLKSILGDAHGTQDPPEESDHVASHYPELPEHLSASHSNTLAATAEYLQRSFSVHYATGKWGYCADIDFRSSALWYGIEGEI